MGSTSMSMNMATATGDMASMSTAMSMPMATDKSTMMPMSMMAMTFFSSTVTPLFSTSWTPTSAGQYAGTCIFLIAFAAIFRALIAIRFNYDRFSARMAQHLGDNQAHLYNDGYKGAHRPWRANEAVTLGFMDMVIAGVSYLLMIAVMTMNVGYFLSVLAGVFIGSMAFGRFMHRSVAH